MIFFLLNTVFKNTHWPFPWFALKSPLIVYLLFFLRHLLWKLNDWTNKKDASLLHYIKSTGNTRVWLNYILVKVTQKCPWTNNKKIEEVTTTIRVLDEKWIRLHNGLLETHHEAGWYPCSKKINFGLKSWRILSVGKKFYSSCFPFQSFFLSATLRLSCWEIFFLFCITSLFSLFISFNLQWRHFISHHSRRDLRTVIPILNVKFILPPFIFQKQTHHLEVLLYAFSSLQ